MKNNPFTWSKQLLAVAAVLVAVSLPIAASPEFEELAKSLPLNIGSFRRVTTPQVQDLKTKIVIESDYVGRGGARFTVAVHRFPQDGKAYEFFTATRQLVRGTGANMQVSSNAGTATFISPSIVGFFKGPNFVHVLAGNKLANENEMIALVSELEPKLDRGEGDIPVLIKHLPNWEQVQQTALYLNRFTSLDEIARDGVLNAINSEGDADAVLASYDSMRLLIIEFNTPQRALENDQRIMARVQELWKLGQPAPTAYKRVGNYSVFVFDAPSDQAAKQLIDQVQYEQVVSWLGENPNVLKEAQKQYVRTTLGVLVAVIKASGFALVACFASGALLGTLLFRRRRAQQRTLEAFSDAGGMLRLNLDEMTPQTNPARLISRQ